MWCVVSDVFVDEDGPVTDETYLDVEDFCQRLHPELVSTFALYTGSLQVGEELAQEALIRACSRWVKLSGLRSPRSWTFRVGFNLANSWWRRQRVERRVSDHLRARGEAVAAEDLAGSLAVRAAVAGLPRRQRAALICRYFADLSVNDTAELLGCAPGTIKALTSQAVSRLRAELKIDIEEEER